MAKPTLVLLAGLLNDDALWQHQTDHLADHADIIVGDTRSDDDIHAMAPRSGLPSPGCRWAATALLKFCLLPRSG